MIALYKQQKIFLIIGIVLALIAVVMIRVYIEQQRNLASEQAKKEIATIQANQTAVLAAKKDIPKGVTIEPDMLETIVVPNKYIQPQAVTSMDRISGMTVTAAISKGEQITLSKLTFGTRDESGDSDLAGLTPMGKRAVTISVDNIAALAGMIKPGDYVDVISMIPLPAQTQEGQQATQAAALPLFQNVLVLAVGQNVGTVMAAGGRYRKPQETKEFSPLITLALGPQEASFIAFVQEQVKIKLVLRSPADSQIQEVQPASWETLFQYIMPKDEAKKPEIAAEETKPAGTYIEIYRGLNKEKILISQ